MNLYRSRAAGQQGLTMIELLVVITILVILSTILAAGAMGFRARANRTKTRTQIAQISTALEAYRTDFLRYPVDPVTDAFENNNPYILEQLSGRDMATGAFDAGITGDPSWNGPYLQPPPEDIRVIGGNRTWVDAWGNAINLRLANDIILFAVDANPPANNQLTFDVWSNGPDGADNAGGGDDLANF